MKFVKMQAAGNNFVLVDAWELERDWSKMPLAMCHRHFGIGARWPMGDTVRIFMASSIMGLAVFGIQNYLGTVLGLVVAVPVGLVLYLVAIVAAGAVHEEDIYILDGIQSHLPVSLRTKYAALTGVARRVVEKGWWGKR